jgi:hypothetical protein
MFVCVIELKYVKENGETRESEKITIRTGMIQWEPDTRTEWIEYYRIWNLERGQYINKYDVKHVYHIIIRMSLVILIFTNIYISNSYGSIALYKWYKW